MLVKYKVGSLNIESYNVSDIANVKGFSVTDVEVEFELSLDQLPELVGALAKLKATASGDKAEK